jgi:hypothetical protein
MGQSGRCGPQGERRRSYSQIDYDVARELRKPIYLFLAAEDRYNGETPAQTDEQKKLQLAHRRAIQSSGYIYYQFTGPDELRNSIIAVRFPARSAEAPRRVSNLPYRSLGPLFKGRDTACRA